MRKKKKLLKKIIIIAIIVIIIAGIVLLDVFFGKKDKDVRITDKQYKDLVGNMVSEGTTPRQITDLLGSLCDLTSGSGDKGTPVVLIQGYFDNYADE